MPAVRARIDGLLAAPSVGVQALDRASGELLAVSTEHADRIRLLSGIVAGIGFAAGVLAFIAAAALWLPVVVAGAYLVVAATALLVGMDYVGSRQVLGWTTGVEQVVEQAQSGPPKP